MDQTSLPPGRQGLKSSPRRADAVDSFVFAASHTIFSEEYLPWIRSQTCYVSTTDAILGGAQVGGHHLLTLAANTHHSGQ